MRRQMTTATAMTMTNVNGDGTEAKLNEILDRMIWDSENDNGVQLNHMNAVIYGGRTLKSYGTLVAYFDGINVIEIGSYSTTTSKQVTAFANMKGADVIRLTDAREYINNIAESKFLW